jgi:hypothetical protein
MNPGHCLWLHVALPKRLPESRRSSRCTHADASDKISLQILYPKRRERCSGKHGSTF